jgi:uroporphyrinogen III methyltransferase/synthase
MGVSTARQWSRQLIVAGLAADSPVALIRRCSWPDQQVLRCRLDELADRVAGESELPAPAIAIVGSVAASETSADWFQRRPLFGRRILVTRPRHQAKALERPLRELGADVRIQPAIEISDPEDWAAVDHALHRLSEFDVLVFSSTNGVEKLLERLLALGYDLRALGGLRLAAIGPGTAEALASYHLRADVIPPRDYRAEGLLDQLLPKAANRRFLLVRASRGRELLAEELRKAGADVEQVVVYRSRDVERPEESVLELLDSHQIDWVTVTSSAIATWLAERLGDRLTNTRLVSISPVTSATLRQFGLEPHVESQSATMDGIVAAILDDAHHR